MTGENLQPGDLLSAGDVAAVLGVTPAAVSNWQARLADFPQPWDVVACCTTPLWLRREILDWAAATGRGPR